MGILEEIYSIFERKVDPRANFRHLEYFKTTIGDQEVEGFMVVYDLPERRTRVTTGGFYIFVGRDGRFHFNYREESLSREELIRMMEEVLRSSGVLMR